MTQTSESKLKLFHDYIIPHPEYKQILNCIHRSIEATKFRGEPASALIFGNAGTGKSTAGKAAVDAFGPKQVVSDKYGTKEIVPAIYVPLESPCTTKTLMIRMLQELGSSDTSGNSSALSRRLIKLLETCETKLIVLDEFDILLAKGAEKSRLQVCEWVRTLLNETLVPIAIVGMDSCEEIINAHPQLSRRYPYRHHMTELGYSNLDPKSIYSKTMRSLGNALQDIGGFSECFSLGTDQPLKAMYLATGGNMNGIRQILYDAMKTALNRNDGTFTKEDLASGADLSFIPAAIWHNNPFRLSSEALNKVFAGKTGQ
jgi:hypothetical protein